MPSPHVHALFADGSSPSETRGRPSATLAVQASDLPGLDKSFQADFYRTADDRLAKVYRPINLYGLVDMTSDEARLNIIRREIACLSALAPELGAEFQCVEDPDGSPAPAIVMNCLHPGSFLDNRIVQGEAIDPELLTALAERIADFHFNSDVCPLAPSGFGSLSEFLRVVTVENEFRILIDRVLEHAAELPTHMDRQVGRWFATVHSYLDAHAENIDRMALVLGEPILGHGDIKTQNVAFENGKAMVLDSAPFDPWRTNTRSMDAIFLRTELETIGRTESAKVFWDAYRAAFHKRLSDRSIELTPEIVTGLEASERLAEFYRNIIFLRLSLFGVDPERRPMACAALNRVCGEMLPDARTHRIFSSYGKKADVSTETSSKHSRQGSALFPPGHPLSSLERASFRQIQQSLAEVDLSFIFRSDKYDSSRAEVRPCLSQFDGPGADVKICYSGGYLISGLSNTLYLPAEADRSLARYLQEEVGVSSIRFVGDHAELAAALRNAGRRVYSIDELGAGDNDVQANSQLAYTEVNQKSNIARWAGPYGPRERIVTVGALSDDVFHEMAEPGRRLFLKTATGESGGVGVQAVSDLAGFRRCVERLQARFATTAESTQIIVQPEITGTNRRFQIFLDPKRPQALSLVSLTEQIVGDDGIRYIGSRSLDLTPENLSRVGPAIVEFSKNIRSSYPEVFGFLSCDYFETSSGKIVLFDPALRPTGNTASFMLRLLLADRGPGDIVVSDFVRFNFGKRGMPFSEVRAKMGQVMDFERTVREGVGVLPWGYNQYQGEGTFMVVAPKGQMDAVNQAILARFKEIAAP